MPTPSSGGHPAPPAAPSGIAPSAAGPTIAELVTGALKALDTNGDGVISASELAAFQAKTGVSATTLAADVAKVDTNKDGALSTAELTAYITKADANGDGHISMTEGQALALVLFGHGGPDGAPPPGVSATGPAIADIVTDVFKMLDTNSDGTISAAELSAFRTKIGVDAATFAADVAKVDANKDGAISKAELTAYLTAGDTNGDGHISLAEAHALVPLVGAPGGGLGAPGDGHGGTPPAHG